MAYWIYKRFYYLYLNISASISVSCGTSTCKSNLINHKNENMSFGNAVQSFGGLDSKSLVFNLKISRSKSKFTDDFIVLSGSIFAEG